MKSRVIEIFENSIESQKTLDLYNFHLKKFVEHNKLESVEQILSMDNQVLKEKVQDYVLLFKNNGKSPNYIRGITFSIQSLCDSNDKMGINWKNIRKLLGKKTRARKSRPYTTSEIKRMLNSVRDLRNKALILFLSASGVRRGAIPVLKMRDLKQMPFGCVGITVYEGSNEEYLTFINKEANDALSIYLEQRKHRGEIITNDSPVFTSQCTNNYSKTKPISEFSLSMMVLRAKKNAGINFDNAPNLLCHAFRRRFNTILKLNKESNYPLIERLMGHDMKLDNSYFQPTLDDLFKEYCKGMADLTIDDAERLLAERKAIEEQRSEMEKQKHEQKSMQQEIEIIKENQAKMNHIMSMVREGKVRIVDNNNEIIQLELI